MPGAESQLDEQAQIDLSDGRQSLERYYKESRQDALLAAREHFRALVEHNPLYTDGYLMLGHALTENRQEREAIEVYDRALRILRTHGHSDEQAILKARLLKAGSLLRCYRWADVIGAIDELDTLSRELELATHARPTGGGKKALDAWRNDLWLLARAHAENALCCAHLIVLMPKSDSIRNYHLQDLAALLPRAVIDPLPDPDAFADRRLIADALFDKVQDLIKRSRAVAPLSKREWARDRDARLAEVEGYARFRHAEWLGPACDHAFRTDCARALRKLHEAELHRPRDYALLQNIGMIYLSRRYDPSGHELDRALGYFERSVELKPADYYGHQQLGRISLRRALLAGRSAERERFLAAARRRIATAISLRPESASCRFLSDYVQLVSAMLPARNFTAGDRLAAWEAIEAGDRDARSWAYRWMRLTWQAAGLLSGEPEATFAQQKVELHGELERAIGELDREPDRAWIEVQIRESLRATRQMLEDLTAPPRQKLRVPLDSALE